MLLKRCQISISLHPKILFFLSFVTPTWFHNICSFSIFFKLLLDDGCSCLIFIGTQRNSIKQYIHITNIYIYTVMHWDSMLISVHSFKVKIYIKHHNISSNHWGKSYLTAEKTATGTGSYKVQTYKTRTNLHLTNLNLFNSADKPTHTTKFKRWKHEISLGYKIENDWKSEGSGSTTMEICYYYFLPFFTSGSKTPLFIYVEKTVNVNLASMSEHEIQAL